VRLIVDQARCQGHVQCKFTAPDLIELDASGNAHAAHERVPDESEQLARAAMGSCPEHAIRLEQ
jgi:ferredoxin